MIGYQLRVTAADLRAWDVWTHDNPPESGVERHAHEPMPERERRQVQEQRISRLLREARA